MSNERFNFLGIAISRINPEAALNKINSYPFSVPGYICFPDASVVNEASKDPVLTDILNNAWLCMPDGKPSQLAARLQGHKEVSTVSGFHLCQSLLKTELTHYFYGGSEDVLYKMKASIEKQYPDARVLGYKSPPFTSKTAIKDNAVIRNDIHEINQLNPDLVWIGISSPKQDYLMHYYHQQLGKSLMLGVGGVFLYFSDESLKSPEWVKKIGLRWAYRLSREPARLWPKYYGTLRFLLSNLPFFVKALLQSKPQLK